MANLELLYFMHIEKTGGTTMRSVLSMNYPPHAMLDAPPLSRMGVDGRPKIVDGADEDVYHLIADVQNRQHTLSCVAANLSFGIDRFLQRAVRYLTLLREPINRCVSDWYFAFRTRRTAPLWSVLEAYDFDLKRILADNVVYQFRNDQVRMICGSAAAEPGQTEFQLACDLIEQRFLLVGALEYFDQCVGLLSQLLGWRHTTYSKLNQGDHSDRSILPPQADKWFRDANEWDIRLYEWLVGEYLPRRFLGRGS